MKRKPKPRQPASPDATCFLNVDLELVSRADLSPLLDAFEQSEVLVLRNTRKRGIHTLWLELGYQPRDIDHAVRGYAALVRHLPPRLRRIWNGCSRRGLNVGIQCEQGPHQQVFEISEAYVLAAAKLSASVALTVYAPPPSHV
jgi:hypothetical protein